MTLIKTLIKRYLRLIRSTLYIDMLYIDKIGFKTKHQYLYI